MSPKTSEQFKQIRNNSKTKILVAALELFAIDGFHNTSISKIAKHAGISKGLMYNYFESKEALLTETIIMSMVDAQEASQEVMEGIEELPPQEVLISLIKFFFAMLEENKTMWKLTFSLAMQVSNMPAVEEVITKIFQEFLSTLEVVMKMTGYPDPELESRLLAAQLDGIFFHYIIFKKTYDIEKIKNKLIEKYTNN